MADDGTRIFGNDRWDDNRTDEEETAASRKGERSIARGGHVPLRSSTPGKDKSLAREVVRVGGCIERWAWVVGRESIRDRRNSGGGGRGAIIDIEQDYLGHFDRLRCGGWITVWYLSRKILGCRKERLAN